MKRKLLFSMIACLLQFTMTAQTPYSDTLDINNVAAVVFSNGNYFWDMQGGAPLSSSCRIE